MKKRKCYLFVFNGYADWEPALAIATLNQYSDFSIHAFSVDGLPVRSMGGLKVQPEISIADIDPKTVDLLILPGGESWSRGGNEEIASLVKNLIRHKKNIAAICDATIFLARSGYLDTKWHTSNGPHYLSEKVPGFKGQLYFENLPSVVDENIITANGAGMIEFSIEILRQQKVMDEVTIGKIYDLYKTGGVNNRLYQ